MIESFNAWRFSFYAALAVMISLALAHAHAEEGMKLFVMNHREGADSLINLSFLLDPPAGKQGFIRIQGQHHRRPNNSQWHIFSA